MSTIGLVVRNLEHPEKVVPMVQKLGARHNSYGAQAAHYPVVGEALLWTLEQGLGAQFTPAHRKAWEQTYALLSGLMIEAQAVATKAQAA
jgi:hemoglobin-like flavoprotein